VKLGLRAGDWVEVLEGLSEGDHIVTSANFLIDSESRLKAAVGGMKGMQH
jgi:Cu(I)/Ag(I) efflux system membrane fusion protein